MARPRFLRIRNWWRRTVAFVFPRHARIAQQAALIAALNDLVEGLTERADEMRNILAQSNGRGAVEAVEAYDRFIGEC